MAAAIAKKFNLGLKDVQSRLSRKDAPKVESMELNVRGEWHNIKFYATPAKFL